ncbi:hypothetical protein EFY79_07750 [Hanamia caeni]|uniref:Beta-carotene 15,15'-monooxygenase n=1 Tax=Hanamia caeni TaxID=2294116 RepID=A0A3M9NIJ9_9BACT|nr:DUF6427 family protein [Hanamia caeni]RNI37285.1 hypothetical protein EFY79_07750 [Hanamia caeni]
MTGIFRTNNPLNTFLLFVYGILLKFAWLSHPQIPVVDQSGGFLFNDLIHSVKPYFDQFPKSYFLVAYLLLFSQAITLNQVIISRRMMQKPDFLPAMSYLLITSFFPEWNILSAPLIVNSFLIWVWSKMSNLNSSQHPKGTLFNVGLAIGIASFFYLPSFAFVVFVISSLVITRPPKVAEWLITFIGVLTPWYFLFAWLFLTNKLYSFKFYGFGISEKSYNLFYTEWVGIGLIVIMILAGAFYVQSFMNKQILQVRKNWGQMSLYLAICIGIPFIIYNHNISYWLLALVPASAFIGCAFYYPRRRWIPMAMQWLMVAFAIYIQYFKK